MARYVLFLPEGQQQDREAIIVKDSFSILGLIVPVLWLLWHRMWIAAILAFALLAFGMAAAWYWAMPAFAFAIDILVSAYVAVEGPALRMNVLRWAGWREAGAANVADRQEAELRLFASYLDQKVQPSIPAETPLTNGFIKASDALPFAFPSRR
jgi:hypothetical protein